MMSRVGVERNVSDGDNEIKGSVEKKKSVLNKAAATGLTRLAVYGLSC